MLDPFYGAFSPVCFALLGLWLVVVQIRIREWQGSESHRRRAYGIALPFALPGAMALIALVDDQNAAFWQAGFAIVALGGAAILYAVRGLPAPADATEHPPGFSRNVPARVRADLADARRLPAPERAGAVAYFVAIVLYIAVGVLAIVGGIAALRAEAVLLTALVFLGFNVAWLLLFDRW